MIGLKGMHSLLDKIPKLGKPIARGMELAKRSFKSLLVHGMIFEEMGFKYLGPIDGHNIGSLIKVMEQASKMEGPVFIHVATQKERDTNLLRKTPNFSWCPSFYIGNRQDS